MLDYKGLCRKSQKYKGIKFIKYPSANSLNPLEHGLNIVLTQCNRFYKLDTLSKDFIKDVTGCLIELQLKGYNKQALMGTLKDLSSHRQELQYMGPTEQLSSHVFKKNGADN